jgi:PAS domain S-box-containing protein
MKSLYGRIQNLLDEARDTPFSSEMLLKELNSILSIYSDPEYLAESIPLNHLNEMIVIFRNYEPTICNDKVERLTGFTFSEFKEVDIIDFFHPDDKITFGPILKKRRAEKASDDYQFTHRLFHQKKKKYVWLETLESSLVDHQGNTITFLTSRDVTSERENIEKITELSNLARFSSNRICKTDEGFSVLYCNDRFRKEFSQKNKNLIGRDIFSCTGIERHLLPQNLGKKKELSTTVRIKKKWFKLDITQIGDDSEIGYLWSFVDIDKQKQISEQLEDSNRRLSLLSNLSSDAIWSWNLKSDKVSLSGRADTILGLKEKELPLDFVNSIIHPEDLTDHKNLVRELIENDKSYRKEIRMRHTSGHYTWLELRATKVDNDEVIGVISDINQRKESELSIKKENQRLDMIASALPGAIYQFRYLPDGSFDFPYVSSSISTISHLTPQNYYDDPNTVFALVHPDDIDGLWKSIQTAIEKKDRWEYETRFFFNETYKWLYGHSIPREEDDGTITFNGIFLDVTSQKNLEHKLAASIKELNEAQRIAKIGSYVFDAVSEKWTSSEVLDQIFGIDEGYDRTISGWVNLVSLDYQTEIQRYLVEDVFQFTGAIEKVRAFDHVYPIINQQDKKVRYVHGVGDVYFDEKTQKPLKLQGVIRDVTEEYLAQEKIREQRELLQISQDVAHVGHWVWNLQTFELEWSDQTFRIWGYEPQSFQPGYKFYIDSIHPDDRQNHIEAIEEGLRTNTMAQTQVRILRKDGSTRIIELHGQGYKYEDGKPISVIGIVKDVTDDESFKRILAESESRYRFINEFTTDGIWTWDLITHQINLSKRFYKILETDPIPNISYEEIFKHIHKDDLSVFEKALKDLVKKDVQMNIDLRCKTKSEEWKWIKVQARAIRNEEKWTTQVVGTMRDITDAKNAEQELIEKERRLRKAQETAKLGYWDYYPEQNHYFFSEELKRLFGLEKEVKNPLSRDFLSKRAHPEDMPKIIEGRDKLSSGEKVAYEHRLMIGKEIRWMKVIAEPILDDAGNITRISGVTQDVTEQKEAEQLLLEQKGFFENLNNNLPGVISKYRIYDDGQEEIVFLGDGIKGFYGISPQEAKADSSILWKKIHNDDVSLLTKAIEEVKESRNDINLKWRVKKSRQKTSWIHCLGTVSRFSNYLDIDMVLLDITQEMEQEIQISEFNRLFEISSDFFAIINKEGYFEHVNPQWQKITGYSFKNILSIPYAEIVHEDDRVQIEYYINRLFDNQYGNVEFTNRNLTSTGDYIWLEWKMNYDEHSERIYAVARDITDMKDYQSKLQHQEENMRFLAKSAMDFNALDSSTNIYDYITEKISALLGYNAYVAFTTHDEDRGEWTSVSIRSANKELSELLNSPELGLLGLKGNLEPGDEGRDILGLHKFTFLGRTLVQSSGGLISESTENRIRQYFDLQSNYVIGISDEKSIVGSIHISLGDVEIPRQGLIEAFCKQAGIAVRKHRLQKDLEEMNNTKNKLFSFISHDLKSPFITLINLLKLLEFSYSELDEQTVQDLIKQLTDKTKNIYSIFENMLIWSRNQSGLLALKQSDFNFYQLIEESYDVLEFTAINKDIKVDLEGIDRDSKICADREMIGSVVRNLLSNALKFTPKNGKIKISTSTLPKDGKLTFSIKDTGIGIPQEDWPLIFDAKKHIVYNGTDNERGTGVGLALCKEFVEKNEGEIWFKSEKNKGTTFYFTVPISK